MLGLHVHANPSVLDDKERSGTDTAVVESAVNALKPTFGPDYIEEWLTAKKSAADVVKLLMLDKAENVLRHPTNFAGQFVKQFNLANPESRTSLIKVLTNHYGEYGMFKIIEAAKQVPDTARLARRLQEEQFQYWLGAKRNPRNVFALMKLDKAGEKLFEKPEIITWVEYLDQYNKMYAGKLGPVSLLFLMSKNNEKTFVHMLIAAKEVPSTEELAVRVQAKLTLLWLRQQRPPDAIFELLNLHEDDFLLPGLFDNPLFAAWMKYVDDYNMNVKNRQKADVLEILQRWYSIEMLEKVPIDMSKSRSFERLALEMKAIVQKAWFTQLQSPVDVQMVMEDLKPPERSTLHRALEDYPIYFHTRLIQKNYDNEVNALKKHFKETKDLAKMVLDASMKRKTERVASRFMDVLLEQWVGDSVEPTTVRKWLRFEHTAVDSVTKKQNDITEKENEIAKKQNDITAADSVTKKQNDITEKENEIAEQQNEITRKLNKRYRKMYNKEHNIPSTKRHKSTHSEQ
ncbi:unnamed protein product [Peronospora effusa]|nr:unnamed protein product [Peronospora effusa]